MLDGKKLLVKILQKLQTIKTPVLNMGSITSVSLPYKAPENGFLVCRIKGGSGYGFQQINTSNGAFICPTINTWNIDTTIPLKKGATASQGDSHNITARSYRFVSLTITQQ